MASILDRYGIKEVADVVFCKIKSNGTRGEPVLYLDTLKVSTIEQTAETADARGGKGNPKLVSWDYGKEINVSLEDALFSAKSMSIMFGDGTTPAEGRSNITRTATMRIVEDENDKLTFEDFLDEYTADWTEDFYSYAMEHNAVIEARPLTWEDIERSLKECIAYGKY